MDQKLLEEIIRNLQDKVRCPACGHRFKETEIRFKGLLKKIYLFEFGCPVCSTMLFAKVLINRLPSSLPQAQPVRLKNISPIKEPTVLRQRITTNNIIQLHQELKNFDGNFEKLFL